MSSNQTPLYDSHCQAGADFTDFGGWEMPVSFDSIREEHRAVRDSVGLFDVSHMGQLVVDGPDAETLLHRLVPSDIRSLQAGAAQYSCFLRSDGVILDDIVVYDHPSKSEYVVVPNAGHDEPLYDRLCEHADRWDLDVTVENRTAETGMIAVQGPEAVARVETEADDPIDELQPFTVAETSIGDVECLVARTGYTGEDGVEILFPGDDATAIDTLFDDVQRCGLGARDTLRLEAGLLLSGQDFDPEDEPHTPYEAGIGFVVDLDSGDFVGRSAVEQARDGTDEQIVGLRIEERAIARHGYEIRSDGDSVGRVTSGTMSPSIGIPIALGYVDSSLASPGTELTVLIRDRSVEATVVETPFLESCGE
ncbi:glycine cleavage system aminomethyltransferase GcvT [Halobellus sp. Atlit-38R]|uniref:glycine cleavage system aminomethyltransferase GcvT n=1 Tax=Halobellus sp. Atlit-38R TaxID=2282131 RepID=UPI000EF1C694|nr:glycine cleavage system aminomethyltransferase GcvT [Halobellus sp. Atlit-38R]RLM88005.1 glycine cleavage system aminomethyltransferase GcvT [Halobellus sp. Atlit-38R]